MEQRVEKPRGWSGGEEEGEVHRRVEGGGKEAGRGVGERGGGKQDEGRTPARHICSGTFHVGK